jgi:small-conductance mechanosensitive channel
VQKLVHIVLITFAVLIVLSSMGIDFSSLALFTGCAEKIVRLWAPGAAARCPHT